MNVKTNDYYGTLYAGITMNVKTNDYYGTLYASIVMNVKTNEYYGTLYAGIAMNVKTNDYYGTHMGYCNECKKPTTIMGSYMRVLQCMYKTNGY
jgi:hypothetical protein